MKNLLTLTPFLFLSTGCTLNNSIAHANGIPSKSAITILDERSLIYPPKQTIPFSEISDLSYDNKSHKLYMVGDKGNFYTFSADFKEKIMNLNYLSAYKIDEKKRPSKYDTEGLTHDNKGNLYLSFERSPRIASISKKGYLGKNQKLTKELKNKKNYQGTNKIFEALAWHKKYGLLTVAEYPLHKKKTTQQTVYSIKGKKWHFQAEKYKNSAVTAIEVMDDNHLLILERAFTSVFEPMHITLKKLYLNKCDKKHFCKTEVLTTYTGQTGINISNYEGLAKVGKNRYLMVSDNNNKAILSTKLIYFKVNE
jgi:hypothetical protein